jgi:hypothetical protein
MAPLSQGRDLVLERLSSQRYSASTRHVDFSHQFGMSNRSGDQHLASLLDLKKLKGKADKRKAREDEVPSSSYTVSDKHDDRSLRKIRSLYHDSRRSRSEGSSNRTNELQQDDHSILLGAPRSPLFNPGESSTQQQTPMVDVGAFSPPRRNHYYLLKPGNQQRTGLHQHPAIRRHSLGTAFDDDADSSGIFRGGPSRREDEETSSSSGMVQQLGQEEEGRLRTNTSTERESVSRDLLSFSMSVSRSMSSSFSREFMDDQQTRLGRKESK